MVELGVWLRFVLAVLATWRVTHLLAHEDGPADLLVRLRKRVGAGPVGRLMDCFQCLSLWVAAPFALFLARRLLDWLLVWLATSGATCLLERVSPEPMVIERVPERLEGDSQYGMLRSETRTTIETSGDGAGEDRPAVRN